MCNNLSLALSNFCDSRSPAAEKKAITWGPAHRGHLWLICIYGRDSRGQSTMKSSFSLEPTASGRLRVVLR